MKHVFSFLAVAFISIAAHGQVVTTEPAIVQRNSSPIVITFHADKGNQQLMGLSADTPVFAHTGVILEGDDDWSFAPSWLDNSDKYKLTYVGPNTYELKMESIDKYFGTKSNDEVIKLAFVFRNASGSLQGKTSNNGDIFVDVRPAGFAAEISCDSETTIFNQPTRVNIIVNTTQPASIKLYKGNTNSAPIASAVGVTNLVSEQQLSQEGDYKFIAVATAGNETSTESMTLTLVGDSKAKNYPGGTPKMGAVINPDKSVTFCLGAPKKTSAMIIGSWNDYTPTASQVMYYQDYQGYRYFWTTITDIADGKDYIYYYKIDNSINVGDPYARLVLDPWNDKYISDKVFPDMPEYPNAKVDGVPLAVFNSEADNYPWKIKNFKGVDQSQLIVYELLIRDFTGTEGRALGNGTIEGVMSKLDYIKNLGVNAIELLPIMEFNGNNSWGYNTNFYFAPDKAYGTPDAYRELIDAIHARGMAVILDIVFNQTDGLHPWYQMYPLAENPFYNGSAPHSYSVLNDWNQDNPLVQQQFKDAVKYWLTAYNIDGFRFDLVKGLGSNQSYDATYNASTNTWSGVTEQKTNDYNASRVARMKELHDAMREVAPNAYFINENLAGAKEENEMAQDGEINWANINEESCQFAMGYQSGSNLNKFYAPSDDRRLWGSTVSYAESHDEERMAYKISQYGVDVVKKSLELTCRRLGSVAAQMLMTPGAHMIWQFQEFGANETTKNADGSNNTSPKKVVWTMLDNPFRAGLMQSYVELNALRKDNPEMFVEGATTQMQCGVTNWGTGRSITLKNGDKTIWLIVNPTTTGSINMRLIGATTDNVQLLSASYNTAPQFNGTNVSLLPGAYAVFGTRNITESPSITIDDNAARVYSANGKIYVDGSYDSAAAYDLYGRRVDISRQLSSGIYVVNVDGNATKISVK